MKRLTQTAIAAALIATPALAEDAAPPPYLMTEANTVTIAVTWAADSLGGLMPEGMEPVEDLSGGINIYDAEDGFGLSPYSAAYAYVNVAGHESDAGIPARFILGGWYGPDPKVADAMNTHFAAGVSTGASSQSEEGEEWTGTGGDDTGTIKVAVKPGEDCIAVAATLNYVNARDDSLMQIPFEGDFCPAEPVSVEISGPDGSALAQIEVDTMLSGGRLRNGAFAFTK